MQILDAEPTGNTIGSSSKTHTNLRITRVYYELDNMTKDNNARDCSTCEGAEEKCIFKFIPSTKPSPGRTPPHANAGIYFTYFQGA
jgi:hypothetical protein